MSPLRCSVVIATYQRPEPLRRALESLRIQTQKPVRVIVVDASGDFASEAVSLKFSGDFEVHYLRRQPPSAAVQRNTGMDLCESPLVLFMDDDATLVPSTLERLNAVFEQKGDKVGGVSARMKGFSHRKPRGLLWLYYRFQAGYSHPTYGGKLFGPAINCMACYDDEDEELLPAQWLPSGCVMFRTELVKREKFPEFSGYSFMEDVHISARIAKTHELYYHSEAWYRHEDAPSPFKTSKRELARHRLKNQRRVAREVMGQKGPVFEIKFLVHRLFSTWSVLRFRGPHWLDELIGLWT